MIYFIGGAPRVGKSKLALQFVSINPMPSFSCDFFYDLDQVRAMPDFERLGIIEKAEAFYPILQRLVGNIDRQSENCLIEGEVILPRHVIRLLKNTISGHVSWVCLNVRLKK